MITLQTLITEIETEFSYLNETSIEVQELLSLVGSREPTKLELAGASQYISQFYNGIENILKRIVKYNKLHLPKSEDWHNRLIKIFDKDNENCKIPLFDIQQIDIMNSYRKIRHVVRQGYNFLLDWSKLSFALENIPSFLSVYQTIILNYLDTLKS